MDIFIITILVIGATIVIGFGLIFLLANTYAFFESKSKVFALVAAIMMLLAYSGLLSMFPY